MDHQTIHQSRPGLSGSKTFLLIRSILAVLSSDSPIQDHQTCSARVVIIISTTTAEAEHNPTPAEHNQRPREHKAQHHHCTEQSTSRQRHRQKHHKEDVIEWLQACKKIDCVLLCHLKRWWLTLLSILCCQLCCQLCCFVIRLALCFEV